VNEEKNEGTLSTADMVAAGEHAQERDQPEDRTSMVKNEGEGSTTQPPMNGGMSANNGNGRLTGGGTAAEDQSPLIPQTEAGRFRSRWDDIQRGFVDEPRRAVERADGLVAEAIQQLAKVFADERSKLEGQWSRGDDVSTDDLRLALQRYRSFFERLLQI
jgi:hypothetical protein